LRSQDCLVSILGRLGPGCFAFWILVWARNFLHLQNIRTLSRDNPAPCSMGNGAPYLAVKWSQVMLISHLHLMPCVRKSGTIHLLLLFVLMEWREEFSSIILKTRLAETMLEAFLFITINTFDLHSVQELDDKFWLFIRKATAASFFFCHHLPPAVHIIQSYQLPPLSLHYLLHWLYLLYIFRCCLAEFHAALHP